MASILIVDDEKNIRTHLVSYLRDRGHEIESAANATEALAALSRRRFDVVLSDVRMPGVDGMTLLREVKESAPETAVILMTAYATVAQAVEAIKAGGYDYLAKPFSLEQVDVVLARALEVTALRRENRQLRRAVEEPLVLDSSSAAMQRALETARRAAVTDVSVLLTGESGTGKSVLARQIHAWSSRRAKPFVTIACTTLAEHLLESELFGHVKGAFTGAWKDKPGRIEAADGGTLFFDEVGELARELQAKLLRFLEERRFERVGGSSTLEVDVRVLAATNRDLETEIGAGHFRADLFYRLNVVSIQLPALRDRREDIAALLDQVLATLAVRHGRESLSLSQDARAALVSYHWPGNVREMLNTLERAAVLARGSEVGLADLPDRMLEPGRSPTAHPSAQSLDEIERLHIVQVLSESATLEDAAARLGINVTTLWRKRKRYGID
jgi:DNA-binding NtrC family response regulator